MKFTGERTIWMDPRDHLKDFIKIHSWYMKAMEHCFDKTVIDVGSGEGFGSMLLSTVAKDVIGCDIISPTEQGRLRVMGFGKLRFHTADLNTDRILSTDICVAIEFLEHLKDPEFFLENLQVDELFLTIPCYGDRNEFHLREYNEESAKKLIEDHFKPSEFNYSMEGKTMIGLAIK